MLQKIRPSIIMILSILNFLSIFVLFLIISYDEKDYKYKSQSQQLSESRNNPNIYNSTNEYYINNDINNKESAFAKYFFDNSSYYTNILILNILCSYFLLLLIFSFCIGENDCCCEGTCHGSCYNGNCTCNNCSNSSDGGKAMLICLVFVCLILIIYYSLKCCGKKLARYISITSISFSHLFMFFLSLLVINGENKDIFRIMIISGISALINLLAIILPNINLCKMFRYNRRILSSDIINSNINQNQLSQINSNVMVSNNNMNNYGNIPIQVNYNIYSNNNQINQVPVVSNEYPVVSNEYNGETPNLERSVNINSNDSNNQFVEENNKEMGMAPLPAFEMQPKN